ncbi:MAG TPA: PilZ domain-containing protein [Vicinamibacterales bacterium]|nr:PilZ domain-containing protein [Vicinamibacterales bacterium]
MTTVRPQRFPLQLPVRYREIGKIDWSIGRTEDISRSGVFIRSGKQFDVEARVEMHVVLPPVASGPTPTRPAEISCYGHVVRQVSEGNSRFPTGYGIAIDQYEFRPAREQATAAARPSTTRLRLVSRRSDALQRA